MSLFTRRFFSIVVLVFAAFSAKGLTAGFTADYTAGCSPLVVHFTNTTTGTSSTTWYSWDLGNGTTSGLTNVSGSYIAPGTYTVTLTAHDGSVTSVFTMTITVYPSPTVSFYALDTAVCPGSSVSFVNTTTGGVPGPITCIWNFGDGFTSTSASPSHVYTTPGYYNVTLSVTNAQGCVTTVTVTAYIHVYNHPSPNFSASATYFCSVPGVAVFTNYTSGTGPFTYTWSFGDGATSTVISPSHTYTATGSYTVKLYVVDGNGCTDSIIRPAYITIGGITAAFTYPTPVCIYSLVTFMNTSSAHISSLWTYGDGTSSSSDTGSHAYSAAGTYNIRLIVYNGFCYDTVYHTITVLPEPTGTFSIASGDPCPPPTAVTFSSTATAGSTVIWSFGDGSGGSGITTSHTYSSAGSDTVQMIITNSSGCQDTVRQVEYIRDMHFVVTAIPTSGCVPLTVNFGTSLTTTVPLSGPYPDAITSYSWNFADGSTSTGSAPTHIFTAVGIYTVSCTIVTSNGCSATDTQVIEVGTPPSVTFTAVPHHVCYGHSVTFTANIITGPVDYYSWDWGDGSSITDSFTTESHDFLHPGIFTVTLVAYYHGCPSLPYTWVDSIIVDSPQAIIGSAYNCIPYTKVQFYNLSVGATSWTWLFGDGTTSILDSPSHTYPTETTYTVSLATYNAASGCRDTTSIVVNLIPPVPHMNVDDSTICRDSVVRFHPTITGGTANDYYWYVNGAIADNDSNASFTDTFHTRGIYSIMLIIRDGHGCLDTALHNNWIRVAKPIDSFSVAPITGCAPMTVTFTDHSTDVSGITMSGFVWGFGDGGSASVATPSTSHTYTAAGSYSVTEIVTDNAGCKDTLTRPALLTVYKPHAVFVASNVFPCKGTGVLFNNTSTGITGSFWMFGDGDTLTAGSPLHTYTAVGTYTVKLVVWDAHGCSDTATYLNYITVTSPHAAFTMDDSFTICPPLSVHFTNTSTGATSYDWVFGDGGTSVTTSPTNLYIGSGLYHVLLVAINSHGCRDTATHTVNLYGYAGAFTYAPLTGCSPLTVHFNAALSNIPSIVWDFADGTTSSTSMIDSTVHTYTVPGAYVPKLILSDGTGCQNSSQGLDTIKVDAVRPGFTTSPHPVCVNTNINYMDTSGSYFSTITSWHWKFTAGDTSDLSSPAYFYSNTGTYSVTLTVTDGWGCTGSVTENIVVNPPPIITASPDTVVCVGDPATLHGYGGVSYNWVPPATLGCPTCQTTSATPTVVTTYTVTGIDANGCKSEDTVTVHLRTLTVSRGWGDTEVCRNVVVPLFDTGGTKYTWIPAAGLSSSSIFDPTATPAATTTYTVIAQYGSCIPDTNYITIIVHQLPTVDAGPDQYLVAGSVAQLNATGTLITDYSWADAHTLSCDTCADPLASMHSTTTYTVTVTSDFGCKASDTVTIYLHCDETQIFIPNSFTPNGDAQNDVFYPRGKGISSIKAFRIYNRWGELLFERTNIAINDISNAWDGSYNGGLPRPDVYVYLIDAQCDTGEPIFLKGDVTIIK